MIDSFSQFQAGIKTIFIFRYTKETTILDGKISKSYLMEQEFPEANFYPVKRPFLFAWIFSPVPGYTDMQANAEFAGYQENGKAKKEDYIALLIWAYEPDIKPLIMGGGVDTLWNWGVSCARISDFNYR